MTFDIPGPVGTLEALLDRPETTPRAGVAFAHPHPEHGGTMHTKVVFRAAKALASVGCVVLRFNFRGVGRSTGTFDSGRGERDDFRAALDYVARRYPTLDLWAAGMSFGAWIALTVGAAEPRVSTLIGISSPVTSYDFSPVFDSEQAKYLIHGERDELFSLREVRLFYSRLAEPRELVVIDSANHLFEGKTGEVGDAIVELFE